MAHDADVIIVGAGLAGLVAAAELTQARRKVIIIDQEPEQSLGGQAFWSLGGLFLVNSPEQRALGIRDNYDLALADWMATAAFDKDTDYWPRKWAQAYVDFASGEKRAWLNERGVGFLKIVGWAERGGYQATGIGNSVPRFHITWGTGPAVLAPFIARARAAEEEKLLTFKFRHCVNELTRTGTIVDGVRGTIMEASDVERGRKSSRIAIANFELKAQAVIVTSGGIGGNQRLVRENWPTHLGAVPMDLISGVPDHVDGRMLAISEKAGGAVINSDRMWHYVEGVRNWNPIWSRHGIRILPGPSSLWLDARGRRLPAPLYPGFDTLGTLRYILSTGYDYSWFILNRRIIGREFALSGSEQNPDLTNRNLLEFFKRIVLGVPKPIQDFMDKGSDFIVERDLATLVNRMNHVAGGLPLLTPAQIEREIRARDAQVECAAGKDSQLAAIRSARPYTRHRLVRVAQPHRLLDPSAGPLIAVRLNILTRKFLGGLHTDLDSRVLGHDRKAVPGLYAAGEVAGFGGGGVHGYAALEGSFLGGCIFSGRAAGRAAAQAVT